MEEEKVLKDFPDKQITIDINPEELERARVSPDRLPIMKSPEILEPEHHIDKDLRAALQGRCRAVPSVTFRPEESEANGEDPSDWIIYKVPNKLRKIRPAAYTPQLVSIGPFHHGVSNLKAMEHYKAKYMEKFLRRSICNHINEEDLIHEITNTKEDGKLVEKAERSYKEETFEPENKKKYRRDSKKYWEDPKNILRDACFILELFLRNHENPFSPPDEEDNKEDEKYSGEYILSPWVKASIEQDLILLENQLPFFVLTRLFNFIFNHPSININNIPDCPPELKNNEGDQLVDFLILITCEFFNDYYSYRKSCTEENSKNKPFSEYSEEEKKQLVSEMKPIKHLTDDKTEEFPKSSYGLTRCLYSAKQLDDAGVAFGRPKDATYLTHIKIWPDVKDDDKCCWWNCRDRCWWNGRGCCWLNGCCGINCLELKIPQLKVDNNTDCIFRNIMALEQFVYPDKPRICNYIFLLDQLIDTVEDVVFLIDKGIIENWLGSNRDVAALVNKLCDQIVTPRFLYTDICDKLNKHHNKKLNVARSTLKRVYFKDIWTGSSTVVGLVFLVFSLFSTYSTIKNLFFV
ncbi:uncharacterized protein LOC107422646 [Ziziphus jujuba]|uniref:Uncharacterized protein LOC107422646 n=1 Tax=Ziziphus jujuba TaxID=326968 RepID=A0A6P4AGJ2_ZIZJJ|nr:uncharacterized protein LOC107422646 [Ziziphus jujuba]